MTYSIRQVSEMTGLAASTLRYYENERLLHPVRRSTANRRVYEEGDMDWIALITCLKNTGMPIQEIRRFVALCNMGDRTLEERRQIILAHKRATEARIAKRQQELAHIEDKAAYYEAACRAGTEDGLRKPNLMGRPQRCFDPDSMPVGKP